MAGRPIVDTIPTFASTGTGALNNISVLDSKFAEIFTGYNDSSIGYNSYVADTGVANAYVLTLPAAPSAYVSGMTVSWLPLNTNTGVSTVNVNSLGAVSLLNLAGQAVSPGDIVGGSNAQVITMVYTGTNFQIISPIASNVRGSGVSNFANAKVIFDDFFGYPLGSAFGNNVFFGSLPWLTSNNGNGGGAAFSNTNITAAQTAFGELLVNMGTTGTSFARIIGGGLWSGLGALELDFRFNLGILPSVANPFTAEIGLDDINIDQQNSIYFADLISGGNPVWQGTCQNGGVVSTTSTIAAATGYNRYKIIINPSWTSISFFQGTTQVGSSLTTNIPTGKVLYPVVNVFSNGSVLGANTYIDQFYMAYLYAN